MSSMTILIGLGIFTVVGKTPSMEDLHGSSLRATLTHKTLKILPRGVNDRKLVSKECRSMLALESAECFDFQHNFLF